MSTTLHRIIAYHPNEPGLYLVCNETETVRSPYTTESAIGTAQVLDARQGILFPPMPLISLCARTPWQHCQDDQTLLADLLKQIKLFGIS